MSCSHLDKLWDYLRWPDNEFVCTTKYKVTAFLDLGVDLVIHGIIYGDNSFSQVTCLVHSPTNLQIIPTSMQTSLHFVVDLSA